MDIIYKTAIKLQCNLSQTVFVVIFQVVVALISSIICWMIRPWVFEFQGAIGNTASSLLSVLLLSSSISDKSKSFKSVSIKFCKS